MINILKNNKKLFMVVAISILILIVSIIGIVIISNITKYNNEIEKIYVSKVPSIIEYEINDEFTIDGLIVHAVKNNGDVITLNNSDLTISGFDSSKAVDKQKIRIEYQNYTCFFTVKIKEAPKPTLLLVSIELESLPNKLIYKIGEWLDTSGGIIIRKYNDGSQSKIALINSYIYGYTKEMSNTPGTYTLTVKYVEKGILAETTFEITIEE